MSYTAGTLPMITMEEYQRRQDADHLNLLAIAFYIVGALTAAFSSILLIHFSIGLMALTHPAAFASPHDRDVLPAQFMGWMFTLIGGGGLLFGWTLGGLTIWAGRCIGRRTGYRFLQVMAVVNCLHMPVGTLLGVFTLLVLSRPTVKALFGVEAPGVNFATHPNESPWYRSSGGQV